MLNKFAKFLLVATSLSPILGAIAINQYSLGKPVYSWFPWVFVALLLILICWGLLEYSKAHGQTVAFSIGQFENADKEVLAFLLAYLLPFISAKDMSFGGQWMIGVYIIGIIFLVIVHAGVFHFNPVMGLLGYHFYSTKNADGVSQLLISKAELHQSGKEMTTVRLAHNIYLHTGEGDA